jgi:nucleotide-binding universal stress UspA family protein
MGQVAAVKRLPTGDHYGMKTLPLSTSNDRFRHVLLAADLDGSSAHAADEAIDLAAAQGAILLVLTVVPPDALPRPLRRGSPSAERERRDRAAREIVARAAARGVTATSVVWYGAPAEAILEATRTEHPDVVVLGTRKRTNLARMLGSVSSHVAGEAPCPVVIVPA